MKKIKKILALAMAMCMIFSMTTVAFATDGTAESPHIYQYSGAAVEIVVPAETRVYYEISGRLYDYISSGVIMEVTGDSNVVVYYGVRGQGMMPGQTAIEISLDPTLLAFSLENTSTSDITVYVDLVQNQTFGTMDNPYVMEEAGYISQELEAGNSGYWITYTAPEDGTLSVEMYGATDADYNEIGWTYFVNNLTTGVYGETHSNDDEEVVTSESFEVKAGDEIQIMMGTYDPLNMWSAPAGVVSLYASFTPPAGTEGNPILFTDAITEVTIPAGTEVYYQGKFGGTTLVINDADAYVIFNGIPYVAEDGVLTIEIPQSESFFAPPNIFIFGSNSEEDSEYTVEFVYPEGSDMNPKVIEAGKYVAEIAEGSNGFYYTWIAPSSGELTVAVSSETGWIFNINNMTAGTYGDNHYYDDEEVVSSETISVSEGDEIKIMTVTADADAWYAAVEGSITVDVSFKSDEVVTPPAADDDDASADDDDASTDDANKSPSTDDPELEDDKNNSPSTEDAELEQKVNGSVSDKDAVLDVSKPSTDAVNKVETVGKDILKDKKYEVLELDLIKNGIKVTELKDKIQVTLSVFDKIKDAKWVNVYRLDDVKDELVLLTDKPVKVENGKFTFETDHFSTYVFVEADEPKAEIIEDETKTGDTAPIVAMVAIAALAATAAVVVSKKKAEEM